MPEQLEFDLVAPGLAGWSEDEEQLRDEAKAALCQARAAVRQADAKIKLAHISAQLRNRDLVLAPKESNELEELRVLIGKESWTKKECRRWKHRLKRSVVDVQKFITLLRNLSEDS